MSHINPGLLGAYNSLTDKHLTGYFNNTRIRRHLQKVGLISRSGRIVPEKEYRHKLIQRAHQRHVRECLAQAIFHKVLEMERLHQIEIKRKLEEFARRERVHKIKVERSNRYDEEPVMMLSPRPPTGPKNSRTRHSGQEGEHSESTESPGSTRPNTAPGKMQRPVRLKPLNSNSTPASLKRNSSRYRHQDSSNDTDQLFSSMLERDGMRHLTLTELSSSVSPYRLPVINNFVTPVPPLTKRKEKGPKGNGTLRGRRLRPTTAPDVTADSEEGTAQRASAQSAVSVKMVYLGKSVHLSHDLMDLKDEVKVFQQHCGGENLCVFKGRLSEGESFQFVSRRHRGFPFSLTFFLNGLQVERLSSCCEFKHRKGARLGGRHGHFGFSRVEGASPCYRCIIAMGLDKKPTPPKRAKEDPLISKSRESSKEDEEDEESHEVQETERDANRDTKQGDKAKNDYEEDFEADDEGPVEDGVDEGNETSPSPTKEEEEEESKKDENENNMKEKEEDSESESEGLDKNKVKRSPSVSSGLSSDSSDSEEDESEAKPEPREEVATNVLEENVEPERRDSILASEKDTKAEETDVVETSSASLPRHTEEEAQDGVEKSEVEMSEETERDDGEKPGEEPDEGQAEAEDKTLEEEREKSKSVQEKLAEAMMNRTECASEPELSDTTTEDDEVASSIAQRNSPGAEQGSDPPQQLPDQKEEIAEENVAEPLEPAEPAVEENGGPQQASEETQEPSQTEERVEEEGMDGEASDDTREKQEEEQEEQPEGEKQDSMITVVSDTVDPSGKTDTKEHEEDKDDEKEEHEASKVSETKPDDEETAEAEESKDEELMTQEAEKEAEHEDAADIEEAGGSPVKEPDTLELEKEQETKELMEPEPDAPKEIAVDELENQEQTEKDMEMTELEDNGRQEEAPAEDEVKEEVTADEEAAANEDGAEHRKEHDETEEMKAVELTEGAGETEEVNMEDRERASQEEEEKREEEILQESPQQETLGDLSKMGENDLEVGKEERSEKQHVEDTEGNVENNGENEDGEKGETESVVEKDAELEDVSKPSDDSNGRPEEEVKENEDGEKPEEENELEKLEDDVKLQGEAESEVKDENITGDDEKDKHDIAASNAEERAEVSENEGGEEKMEDMGDEEEAEVKEGPGGANMEETLEEQSPRAEEDDDGSKEKAEVKEVENIENGKEDTGTEEEMIENIANQESWDHVPAGEKPEENEAETSVEKVEAGEDAQAEDGSKEETQDAKKETEDEVTPAEKDELVEEMHEEAGRKETNPSGSEEEKQEVEEDGNNGEPDEQTKPEVNEDDQAMTVDDGVKVGEIDAENGEEVVTDQEETGKEVETPAEAEDGEVVPGEEKEKSYQEETVQDMTNEEAGDDVKELEQSKPPSPDIGTDAVEESGVTSDPVEELPESELKDMNADTASKTEEDSITGAENHARLFAVEEDAKAEVAEEPQSGAGGARGTSSFSPSEESQPAETVLPAQIERKKSEWSDNVELISIPPSDQGDLVSNWVNIHQASRYFEKFVETPDDLKSLLSLEGGSTANVETVEVDKMTLGTKDSEASGVDKTSETTKGEHDGMSDHEETEDTLVKSFQMETKPEVAEADAESNRSKDTLVESTKHIPEDKGGEEDPLPSTESLFTTGEQQVIDVDNIMNLSTTSVMKLEISQDS